MAETDLYQVPDTTTLPTYPDAQGYTPASSLPDFTGSQLSGDGSNATLDAGPSTPAPYTPPPLPTATQATQATQSVGNAPRQNNTVPIILGIASALSGNFAPLMQLEEQKRKTELYKFMDPHLRAIESLNTKGEYEKAGDLTDQLMMRVGDRAPEILPYLKEERAQIRQKHENYNAFKNYTHYLDATLAENDPRRETKLAFMKKILANPGDTGVDNKLLESMSKGMQGLHIQIIDGKARLIDPDSMRMTEVPLSSAFELPKGFAASQLQAATGLTPNNIINAMNGLQFEHNGQMYQSTPELRVDLSRRLAALTGTQSQLEHVAPLIPTSPEQVSQQQQLGIPHLNIAGRQLTPEQAKAVQQGQVGYSHQVAQGPLLAQNALDPAYYAKSGQAVVDTHPDTFGTLKGDITPNEVAASGGRYIPLPQSVVTEKVQPAIVALHNLQQAANILPHLGITSASDYLARAKAGIRDYVQSYTGITLRPEDTGAVAARAIVNRALEDLEKTRTVSEASMKQLKQMVTSSVANPDSLKYALDQINKTAQYELGLTMRSQNVQQAYNPQLQQSAHEAMWMPIAQTLKVEPALVKAILGNENSSDTQVSRSGAIGRFQVLPSTAAPYLAALSKQDQRNYTTQDLFNPNVNAQVALLHLSTLQANHPKWGPQQIMAAYIGGEGAVNADSSINRSRQEPPTASGQPGNTVGNYVDTGMQRYKQQQGGGAATQGAPQPPVIPGIQPGETFTRRKVR